MSEAWTPANIRSGCVSLTADCAVVATKAAARHCTCHVARWRAPTSRD